MYQRIGAAAYKADLNNTIAICSLLGNPEKRFKSVHIAGTNGKGSTSHLLASVLQENGYKTGLYTSPHLKDFRERIRINGRMISEQYIVDFVEKLKSDFVVIKPSFFEMTVGLAFSYFAEEKVDIAVVETGMGGQLDSTNVIIPLVSVITNIGIDHIQFLGDTLEKIAFEKAGIIKPGVPVVVGETQSETEPVFRQKAMENDSTVYFADQLIKEHLYKTSLQGIYQKKNIKTVLQTLNLLCDAGFNISEKNIHDGFLKVIDNTVLMGRWQILSHSPLTICDVGHNEDGIRQVLKQISITPHNHLHFVFGLLSDKSPEAILSLMPRDATYYFCKADIPRAMDANVLRHKAIEYGMKGESYVSVKDALAAARFIAEKNDLVFVGGSTFVVAEVV